MTQIYIAILRGINVNGKNMIKMPALKLAMEEQGFSDVQAYLQSGNLIFTTGKTECTRLEEMIRTMIAEKFRLEVPVMVQYATYMKQTRDNNPFLQRNGIDETKLHVTFLDQEATVDDMAKIPAESYLPDEFVIREKVIYLFCPGGYGTTKLNNNFFEKKLNTIATTRNWNTVNKLVDLAREKQEA